MPTPTIPINLNTWDFDGSHVQPIDSPDSFLSSESVVVCSGPPELKDTSIYKLIPIGLVQNVQVSQNKQINQIFEVGSRLPIFIPGRTIVNAALSKVLFDSASLMKALYLQTLADGTVETPGMLDDAGNLYAYPPGQEANGEKADFFINLASKFFNRPLGLGFFLKDMQGQQYGGFYLNNCYIQHHTINLASQQTILVENVSIRASRMEAIVYNKPV